MRSLSMVIVMAMMSSAVAQARGAGAWKCSRGADAPRADTPQVVKLDSVDAWSGWHDPATRVRAASACLRVLPGRCSTAMRLSGIGDPHALLTQQAQPVAAGFNERS